MRWGKPTILGLLAAAVLLLAPASWPAADSHPPNVVLITVDTLRADRLGCYGHKAIQTPIIDALAADSVLFERAIAQVPLTWPSHVVILTGTYPFANGVQDFTGQPLAPAFRSLAESFKDRGYSTGAIVSSFVLDRSWGLARGFDFYYDSFPGQAFLQKDIALVDRRAEESVHQALAWLARAPQPFFLWLHLFDPHSPYDAPEPFRTRYRQRPYDGEVAYVDSQLGGLITWLKQQRLYDGALVVFLSDHGESLGEHGEDEHGFFVYNSTLRVPLLVKPPAGTAFRPHRVAAPVETISVPPTIIRLAGIQDPVIQKQFQAESLLRLMTTGRAARSQPAYAETFYPFSSFGWSPLRSLETERYHYIEAPTPELYDLRQDPQEKNNLAPREPTRVAALRAQLRELVGRYQPLPPAENPSGLDPETIEKLRSLGYVAYRAPAAASLDLAHLSDPKDKLGEYKTILAATDALHAGQFERGRSLLQKVQQTDPQLYLIPFLLGEAASRQGQWRLAAEEFKKCLELNPNFDQAMTGLARALNLTGQAEAAKTWFERALEINPQNFRAWFELALVQASQDSGAAVRSLERALGIQPSFAPALRQLGILQIDRKEFGSALRNLEQAVELGMADAVTHNFLGIAYSRSNRLEEAAASYRRALEQKPNYAEAHLNLAYAYQRLNQHAAAQEEYETACRLEKKFCQYVPARPQ